MIGEDKGDEAGKVGIEQGPEKRERRREKVGEDRVRCGRVRRGNWWYGDALMGYSSRGEAAMSVSMLASGVGGRWAGAGVIFPIQVYFT